MGDRRNFRNNIINSPTRNLAIASYRPYYNNWHHGNWNGNNWGGGWGRGGGGWGRGWGGGYGWGSGGYGWGGYGLGFGGWGRGVGWGYGPGFWGGYWNRPWFAGPLGWGLGAWALGSIVYNSGYMGYSNPYYVSSGVGYDYSTPIQVVAVAEEPVLTPQIEQGTSHVDIAREAFRAGDYDTAMHEIELALRELPNDAALHEFRALVLFAMRDYRQAAAALYAVLAVGPGWDWTTLSGMYPSVDVYTRQLRELEDYVKAHPESADAHFVLAYQYITCNHAEAAVRQLTEVVRLQPGDHVSQRLLNLMGGGTPASEPPQIAGTEPAPGETAEEPPPPPDVDPKRIVGTWTANRTEDGSSFRLTLTPDSKFTWSYTQSGKTQEFAGTYSVDGAILVLERDNGATMPGLVTLEQGGFNFKLYGGPPGDKGLDFRS